MIYIYSGLLLFLIILFITNSYNHSRLQSLEDHQYNLEFLEYHIARKQQELNALNEAITNQHTVAKTNLPAHVNHVLDLYDEANIKIPLDIIEDLIHVSLTTTSDVSDYIENQRLHWKLENSKKPFRKVWSYDIPTISRNP